MLSMRLLVHLMMLQNLLLLYLGHYFLRSLRWFVTFILQLQLFKRFRNSATKVTNKRFRPEGVKCKLQVAGHCFTITETT